MKLKLSLPLLLGVLAFPGSALAAGPAGPLGGTLGCVHDGLATTTPACDGGNALTGATAVVATADGTFVFVAAPDAAAVSFFARDAQTGALTTGGAGTGCIANAKANGCEDGHDLAGSASLALTPDGKVLYVAATTDSAVSGWAVGSDGALTAIPGACFHTAIKVPETGCEQDVDLGGASSVVVSPDGKNLYVGSTTSGTVATYAIGTGGVLTRQDLAQPATAVGALAIASDGLTVYATNGTDVLAWTRSAVDGALSAPASAPLTGAAGVAVAPDGDVIVATGDGVTVLHAGLVALSGTAGCVHDPGANASCSAGHHLTGASAVHLSADGTTVYVAAGTASAVVALSLASNGTLTQPTTAGACSHSGPSTSTCAGSYDIDGAASVALLPNGDVLVAARTSAAVVTLRPQHAPVCVGAAAQVDRAGPAVHLQIGCTDADGDPLVLTWSDPAAGSLLNWNGLGVDYRPNGLAIGTDSFSFSASDGANLSATATETITIFDHTAPKLLLAFVTTKTTRGAVALKVTCKGNDPCRGSVRLTSGGKVIGTASFAPAASGSTRTVLVKLNAAGRALLLAKHKLAVVAVATVSDLAHNVGTSTAKATIRS